MVVAHANGCCLAIENKLQVVELNDLDQTVGRVEALYRYPVKGLSAQALDSSELCAGQPMALDRAWAIENGLGRFDSSAPKYLPKTNFVMLMRHEALASLTTRFDDATNTLTIIRDNKTLARGCLSSARGRSDIEDFIEQLVVNKLRGRPRIVSAQGHSFSDVSAKCLHLVSSASAMALQTIAGRDIDVMRFRPNVVLSGWPAWHEFELVGKVLAIGDVRLKVFKRTMRCAATEVNPQTGDRDMDICKVLRTHFERADFGVYARVVKGGCVSREDQVTLAT